MITYFKACIFLDYVSLGSGIDNILVTFFNVKFKFSFFQLYPYWQFFKGPSVLEPSPVFPQASLRCTVTEDGVGELRSAGSR